MDRRLDTRSRRQVALELEPTAEARSELFGTELSTGELVEQFPVSLLGWTQIFEQSCELPVAAADFVKQPTEAFAAPRFGDGTKEQPVHFGQRLASDFPHATLVPVPGAKAWVPVDNPAAVADAIGHFVPAPVT